MPCVGGYDVPRTLPEHDRALVVLAATVVLLIGPAVVAGVTAWIVALAAVVALVAGFAVRRPESVRPSKLAAMVPWSVWRSPSCSSRSWTWSSTRARSVLRTVFGSGGSLGRAGSSSPAVSTVLANVIDNLPAYLVAEHFAGSTRRLVTVLVGVNVGPMLLVWGSLANLLWLRACRARGLPISAVRFGLEGLLVVPLAVAAGALASGSPRLAGVSAELIDVAPGVVRVTWTAELQAQGLGESSTDGAPCGGAGLQGRLDPGGDARRPRRPDGAADRHVQRADARGRRPRRRPGGQEDRIVYARLVDDTPLEDPAGFRSLLNSFLPRKRAIAQMLIRSTDDRVLLCQLTYKRDYDLPGGVVEVTESPQLAVAREVKEELQLDVPAGRLLLTDWLPPWGGWDDAICLVFDGGTHDPSWSRASSGRSARSAPQASTRSPRSASSAPTSPRGGSSSRCATCPRRPGRRTPRAAAGCASRGARRRLVHVPWRPMLSADQPRRTIFSAMCALVQAVIVHTATQTSATTQEKCEGSWPTTSPTASPA